MKTSKFLTATAILAATIGLSTAAQAAPKAQDFVQKAAIGDMFEIQSSQLALKVSQNDAVKKFAQHMIDDHTKADDALKATLSTANIDPSTVPTALDAKHQKLEDKLSAAKPEDFDKDYLKDQTSAHDEAISLFQSYSKKGDNAALKNFAVQTLPTLQEHKQDLETLKKSGADKMAATTPAGTTSGAMVNQTAPAAGTTTAPAASQ